jgi:putative NADH-flavin reductase
LVTSSGLDWTIVRPPRLTHGPLTGRYAVAVGRMPPGAGATAAISRADLAHLLLEEVERGAHVGHIVGVARARAAAALQTSRAS